MVGFYLSTRLRITNVQIGPVVCAAGIVEAMAIFEAQRAVFVA